MKVYILTYRDWWEDYTSTIGVYSTKKLARKKMNDRTKDFAKTYIDKDVRKSKREHEKYLHDIEEVEVDK